MNFAFPAALHLRRAFLVCLYKPMSELRNFAMTDEFECAHFILEDHAEIKDDIGLVAQERTSEPPWTESLIQSYMRLSEVRPMLRQGQPLRTSEKTSGPIVCVDLGSEGRSPIDASVLCVISPRAAHAQCRPFAVDSQVSAVDRKSTRLNSSHSGESRMPSSA